MLHHIQIQPVLVSVSNLVSIRHYAKFCLFLISVQLERKLQIKDIKKEALQTLWDLRVHL